MLRLRFAPPFAILALLAGCGSVSPSKHMSFATVQALNPGVDGRWILEEFPGGAAQRDGQGRLKRLTYTVDDPRGKSHPLVLDFDEHEILVKKDYGGPLVRPVAIDPKGPVGPAPIKH